MSRPRSLSLYTRRLSAHACSVPPSLSLSLKDRQTHRQTDTDTDTDTETETEAETRTETQAHYLFLLIFLLRVTIELKLELLPKQTSQHTSYVSIRQHSSEYVSIRQGVTIELKLTLLHKQTARHVYSVERYVCSKRGMCAARDGPPTFTSSQHTSAYVCIHTLVRDMSATRDGHPIYTRSIRNLSLSLSLSL